MSEQIPGVPEGYRLKGLYWGHELRGGEWCLNEHGTIFAYSTQWLEHQKYQNNLLPVLERIDPPKEQIRAESIPGLPAGYRLGRRLNWKTNGNGTEEATFALLPIEQPNKYEVVIVVPIRIKGAAAPGYSIDDLMYSGVNQDFANYLSTNYPERVAIRPKGTAS